MPLPWGAAVWTFFHAFCEKVNDDFYIANHGTCLTMFKEMCQHLPCPDCSRHATKYMAGLRPEDINTKSKIRLMFFDFHNIVNQRLGKPYFEEDLLLRYKRMNMGAIFHNFVQLYGRKYNTQLLGGRISSLRQRQAVTRKARIWFRHHWKAFN